MDPNYGHRGYHILTDVSSFHRKGHCLPGKLFSLQKKETGHKGDSYRFQSLKVFQPWQSIWKAAKITGCCLCSFHKVIFTILQPLSLFSSLLPLPFLLLFPLHLSMSSPLFLQNKLALQHYPSPLKSQCWDSGCGRTQEARSTVHLAVLQEHSLGALLVLHFTLLRLSRKAEKTERK